MTHVKFDMPQPSKLFGGNHFGWFKPAIGWVKGNTDETVDLHKDNASCGSVLQDSKDCALFPHTCLGGSPSSY
ncbi:hypothetical protein V6N13_106526 [Hibiscus sabdariffa]|uniref:Uncharacterized protein n=1 Tax=Hibiscus sabdariffa TaxID=183260 RepID=A0ABR2F100_9ROSI